MPRPEIDSSTRELLHSRIRLRDELIFLPRRGRIEWYQIEAPHSGRFFRIGVTEYTFISLLDGETTLGEAISLTARRSASDSFTEDQAASVVSWLLENDLAEVADSTGKVIASGNSSSRKKRNLAERLNPFWLKLSLGSPDRLVERILPVSGWLHSIPVLVLCLIVWLVAAFTVGTNWSQFETSWSAVLNRSNWLWLGLSWLFLKIIHEFAHATACRRHGGEVRDTGIIFILLAPVAYVDVTSSLRIPSRWHRIQITAAGIYTELTVAAVAAIAWSVTTSPLLSHLLVNLIWSASVTTLLFNANPLMRFDGYYILSDLLDRPNLYTDSMQHLSRLARRFFFGAEPKAGPRANQDAALTLTYGSAAFLWRMMICIGLLISASVLFHGAGIILAALGVILWFGRPLFRILKKIAHLSALDPGRAFRAAMLGAATAVIAGAFLFGVPWPAGATAPGVLDHRDLAVVRAETPGFIKEIHVTDGQQVVRNELLIELENEELSNEVADLRASIEQSKIRRRQMIREENTPAVQVEAANHAAMEKRLKEKLEQLESLTVRAPVSGRVMSRSLIWSRGTFAESGNELLAIGDDSRKELRVSISQEDARWLEVSSDRNHPRTINVRLRSSGVVQGTVERILPGATRTPIHESLTAPAGGPLSVKENNDDSESERQRFVLTEPRVTAIVQLPDEVSELLSAGAFGQIQLTTSETPSIAEATTRIARGWIEQRIAEAKSE